MAADFTERADHYGRSWGCLSAAEIKTRLFPAASSTWAPLPVLKYPQGSMPRRGKDSRAESSTARGFGEDCSALVG